MTTTLQILQHALGRDEFGRRKPGHDEDYRNHFVTGPGCTDYDLCRQTVEQGLMTETPGNAITGGDPVFRVTDAGRAYIIEHSPKPPKLTRSQKRYQAWLDADCGLTFAEFNGWRCKHEKRRHAEEDAWRKKVGLPPIDRKMLY